MPVLGNGPGAAPARTERGSTGGCPAGRRPSRASDRRRTRPPHRSYRRTRPDPHAMRVADLRPPGRSQTGRLARGSSLDLVVAVVEPGRDPILLGGDDRAAVLRGLQSASLRRDGIADGTLMDAPCKADALLFQQLRRPGEDREMRFALFPVAAWWSIEPRRFLGVSERAGRRHRCRDRP